MLSVALPGTPQEECGDCGSLPSKKTLSEGRRNIKGKQPVFVIYIHIMHYKYNLGGFLNFYAICTYFKLHSQATRVSSTGGGREEASHPKKPASPPKKSLLKLNHRHRLTHGMLTMSRHHMLMTAPPRKRL